MLPLADWIAKRFAAPDDLDIVLLPRLAEWLATEALGLRMKARPADYRSPADRLDSGDADVALSATPETLEKRHRHRTLYREPFADLHCPRQLRISGQIDLETFSDNPHLFRSLKDDFHGQWAGSSLASVEPNRKEPPLIFSCRIASPILNLRTTKSEGP